MDFVYAEANRVLKKYGTRDPYELLDAIGAVVRITDRYPPEGLKGYCALLNRSMYAVINGRLSETDRKVAAGHEAAHLILHRRLMAGGPVKGMRDFNLYDGSIRTEREANSFLADFIVPDEDVLDAIGTADDYFGAAGELYIPAPLLAFKLYSMMRRGYPVQNPAELESGFLKGKIK